MLDEDPGLQRILSFCIETIEHQSHRDPKTKREEHFYSVKPDLFRLACDVHLVPQELWEEARSWCRLVERAAMDAAKGVPGANASGRRPGELRRVEKKPKRAIG